MCAFRKATIIAIIFGLVVLMFGPTVVKAHEEEEEEENNKFRFEVVTKQQNLSTGSFKQNLSTGSFKDSDGSWWGDFEDQIRENYRGPLAFFVLTVLVFIFFILVWCHCINSKGGGLLDREGGEQQNAPKKKPKPKKPKKSKKKSKKSKSRKSRKSKMKA